MKLILLLVGLSLTGADYDSFTMQAEQFLSTYVKNGRVSYESIQKNPAQINQLYESIGEMDLSGFSDAEKKSFYINAYNLIVIYQVSKYYPLKSPLDASGFFDAVRHKVAGESLTLNALEYKKLMIPHKDARIHFVLACAAKSCPPLASFAFSAESLDKELDARTRLSINDAEWLRVGDGSVQLSKIFQWYDKDFLREGGSILGFVNAYRRTKIPTNYRVDYYEYDWTLNNQ